MEVEIRGIAAGGAGVGSLPDGRTVFVHRTAPGDRVAVTVTEERGRWARGRLEAVLEPGPGRRDPPCPLYLRCGGCTLQHLHPAEQRAAKGKIVVDALARIGGFAVGSVSVAPAPAERHYRSRVTFTLLRGGRGRVRAGFHALENPGRIVEVTDECLLPEPPLLEVWRLLRREWGPGASRLPGGVRLRLTLRSGVGDGVVLVVERDAPEGGPGDPKALLEAVPGLESIWLREPEGGSPRLLGGRPGEGGLRSGGGAATAFVQVNREAARALEDAVMEVVVQGGRGGHPLPAPDLPLRVVDAYCGLGRVGRRLAAAGARVTGIELDLGAAAQASAPGAPTRGGAGSGGEGGGARTGSWAVLQGRVEELLQGVLPADVVLLNPPRAGLHPRVPEILREGGVPRIVYVSCDPATLARDLRRLGPSYRLESVRAFDLFPMTAHVETLAVLGRDAPAAVPAESKASNEAT